MKRLISTMSGNQKGFTLIELLVVVAILGVIAAVVALNVGAFFGRGTVQAANTELHQVQTAIISAMAQCEIGSLEHSGMAYWSGGYGVVVACNSTAEGDENAGDAAFYVYGPLRSIYQIDERGRIRHGYLEEEQGATVTNPWSGIHWNTATSNWAEGPAPETDP